MKRPESYTDGDKTACPGAALRVLSDAPNDRRQARRGAAKDEKSCDHHGQRQRPEGPHGRDGRAEGAGNSLRGARDLRPPDAGGGGGICQGRGGRGLRRDHRGGGQGRPPGRGPGGEHAVAGGGHTDEVVHAGRAGRAAQHRADALGHAGGHRGHRRRGERGAAGRADPRPVRRGAGPPPGGLPRGPAGEVEEKDRQIFEAYSNL